jgi:hypothetical protein
MKIRSRFLGFSDIYAVVIWLLCAWIGGYYAGMTGEMRRTKAFVDKLSGEVGQAYNNAMAAKQMCEEANRRP